MIFTCKLLYKPFPVWSTMKETWSCFNSVVLKTSAVRMQHPRLEYATNFVHHWNTSVIFLSLIMLTATYPLGFNLRGIRETAKYYDATTTLHATFIINIQVPDDTARLSCSRISPTTGLWIPWTHIVKCTFLTSAHFLHVLAAANFTHSTGTSTPSYNLLSQCYTWLSLTDGTRIFSRLGTTANVRTFVWTVGCNLDNRLLSLDFQCFLNPPFLVSFPDTVS